MSLEDLGNIGEFVAAVAVLVTLGYLALQIRQNTKSVRASTFQGITQGWVNWLTVHARNDLSPILYKGSVNPSALNEEELFQYWLIVRSFFRAYENDYYQFTQGMFDADAWSGYRKALRNDVLSTPGFRVMWMQDRENYNDAFVHFVEEELGLSSERQSGTFIEDLHAQTTAVQVGETDRQ